MVARSVIHIFRKKKKKKRQAKDLIFKVPKNAFHLSPALGFAAATAKGAEHVGASGWTLPVPRAGHLPGRVPAARSGWAGEHVLEKTCDLKHLEMRKAPC